MTLQTLETARRLHRSGRVREALAVYRDITDAGSAEPEHWQFRAMAEQQIGSLEEARSSIAKAIELDSLRPEAHLVAGHIAEDLRDFDRAESHFRRATELKPEWIAGWNGLGLYLMNRGRADEAIVCFQRAVTLDGTALRSWNYLGLARLAMERFEEAVQAFNFAVSLDSRFAASHLNLGRVHDLLGQHERALECARTAVQLDPQDVEARLFLGDMQRKRGDLAAARETYTAAIGGAPALPRARNALADVLWESGQADDARRVFATVAHAYPGNFKAAVGARLLLPAVYKSVDDLRQVRNAYDEGLRVLAEQADQFRWPDAAAALRDSIWSNFYLAYQGANDRELQRRYGEFKQAVLRPVVPEWLEPRPRRARNGDRLRVGFCSYFFYNCTVGRYFASWIRDLDPERFEAIVYYTNSWIADDTRAIASAAARFRHLPGRPLHILAQQILADDLDVLVYPELGMNAETFTLASLRLAPVQVAGWGHPATTGLPSIDWFLSCRAMEAENAHEHYTERLATLPGLGTRYAQPSGGAEEVTRADYGLSEGDHLYLVPQSTFKIHPENDELFAAVLERDSKAKIVMFASTNNALTDALVSRVEPRIRAMGTSVRERFVFLPFLSHAAYLGLNRVCNLMLDTLHWSGGNTSLDALASGLPVVTLPGEFMRGRQTLAMLEMLGASELVATSRKDYVDKAVALARDPAARDALSEKIRANTGELFDRLEPVRAFEAFLERAASG